MDRQEIQKLLPHREAMLLLDSAGLAKDGTAEGRYTVTGSEWFLQGHFPGNPVVPGVILFEMMAQTCCVLLGSAVAGGNTPFFTGLDKVKFRRPVKPGETVETSCKIIRIMGAFYFAEGSVRVDGQLACSGQFSFALVLPTA